MTSDLAGEAGGYPDSPEGAGGSQGADVLRDKRRAELIAAAQARWVEIGRAHV